MGNRPSLSLLLPAINAKTVGQLLALYEHRTVVQVMQWMAYGMLVWLHAVPYTDRIQSYSEHVFSVSRCLSLCVSLSCSHSLYTFLDLSCRGSSGASTALTSGVSSWVKRWLRMSDPTFQPLGMSVPAVSLAPTPPSHPPRGVIPMLSW